MTIKSGSTASANDALNYLGGHQFKNYSQLLFNAARIGFNSKLNVATGAPNLKNIEYDCCLTDTASTKTNIFYNNTDKLYHTDYLTDNGANATTVDECNDSSINATIWSTSGGGSYSVAEGASYITGTASAAGSYASLTLTGDIFTKYGNIVMLNMRLVGIGSPYASDAYISLKGSVSGTQVIKTIQSDSGFVNVYLWKRGSVVYYKFGSDGESNVNVSGWSGDLTLDIVCSKQYSGGGNGNFYVDWVRSYDPSNVTLIFQNTGLSTVTDSLATWNSLIDSDNTLTVSISADGTNYETVTDATIHRYTNTGTNLYIKFAISRVDTTAIDKISEYAIWYNLGAS
jgi:hypothetical protein